MKRCTRCVMPDTAPGITFNREGVCSLCQEYRHEEPLGAEELEKIIASVGKGNRQYDCVVPVSGGRDSTYVLYLAKKVHNLKPLAVNYDHEFRVPQAMTNLERACNRLGVELVKVRSRWDLGRKLVIAGLRCSEKHACFGSCRACEYGYHSAAYRAAIQHKVPMIWWGSSKLEKTGTLKAKLPAAPLTQKLAKFLNYNLYLAMYYSLLQQYEFHVPGNAISPRAIPKLKDTSVKEVYVFDYIPWDRRQIKETIMNDLGWEKPVGGASTWRTDCSLYPLLNYCYIKVCGCSKSCFGYCNMINSGQMTREEALAQEEYLLEHYEENVEALLRDEMGLSAREVAKIL